MRSGAVALDHPGADGTAVSMLTRSGLASPTMIYPDQGGAERSGDDSEWSRQPVGIRGATVEGTKRVPKKSFRDHPIGVTEVPVRCAAVLLVVTALAACGDPEDASLCTAFDEWIDARADINAVDFTTESAEDAIDTVEDYLSSVQRLEHAADGRYGQQLDALESTVRAVILTLESVQDDADYSTWSPLVEDDIELATEAALQVEQLITPSCQAEPSGTPDADSSEPSET
jgi:hypothetical protein